MKIKSILIIILTILTTACSSPESKILEQVDSIIIDHPDSALAILKTIDKDRLNKKDLPYYSLLYAQAQLETDQPVLFDLLPVAYEKYKDDTSSDKGVRAIFYLGEYNYRQSAGGESLKYFLDAYEKAKKLDNDYWHARTAKRVKIHFCWIRNFYEGERYAREVMTYFKKTNRENDYRWAILDHAILYSPFAWYHREYEILDSLRQVVANDQPVDSMFLRRIDFELEKVEGEIKISKPAECRYYTEGKRDLAKEINETARDFYRDMIDHNEETAERYKSLFYVSIIVFSIVLFLLVGIFYFSNRRLKAKMKDDKESYTSLKAAFERVKQENASSSESLKNLLKEKEDSLERMKIALDEKSVIVEKLQNKLDEKSNLENSSSETVKELIKEKWSTIDMLCDQLFDLGQTDLDRKRILKNIEKELKKIISTQGVDETIESVDILLEGLITSLRMQCPFLKEDDISFLGLIYAGFSVRAVCMFMGMEYQHFYVKKSRLIKRIEASDAPDKELFISKLRKE